MQHFEKQSVFGIIFSSDRKEVLLVKRRDIPVWVLPGGGLEPGEDPAEATLREVEEETGLKAEIVRKVAEYLPVNVFTKFSHLYECRPLSGNLTLTPETKEIAYFPVNKLPKHLSPPYLGWIQDSLRNKPTLLRKKIEGVSYFVFCKLLFSHPIMVFRYLLMRWKIPFNR